VRTEVVGMQAASANARRGIRKPILLNFEERTEKKYAMCD
jgi:hypothetical protein